jgi:glutamate racemase
VPSTDAGAGERVRRGPAAYHGAVATSTADPRARPIAVYDSGVGGLTVLHELLVQLPHEDFVYLADAARLPYGLRSQDELERFALECAEELLARRAKLLVVACNTATSAALPALRERMAQTTLGIDVLGVVQPGAVQAVAATTNGRVGLMATPATVASGAYAEAISSADPFVALTSVACPDLATIIEGGFPFDERVVDTVREYVAPLREAGVDTVILGCTHYPLIAPMLQRMLGRSVRIVTSGTPVAHQVEHVLGARGLANPRGGAPSEGDYRFLTTGDVEAFRALGSTFLQLPLGDVEHVAVRADLERPEADRPLQSAGLDAPRR